MEFLNRIFAKAVDQVSPNTGETFLKLKSNGEVVKATAVSWSELSDISVFGRILAGAVPAPGGTGTTRFLREDGTWQAPVIPATSWGSITGTLSSQSDLQTALNAKANVSHNHSASEITSGILSYDRLPISATNVSNWNSAFNWGNHASAGYLSSGEINRYRHVESLTSNANANLLNVRGSYQNTTGNGTGNSNFPTNYGNLYHIEGGYFGSQMHFSSGGDVYTRMRNDSTNASWGVWNRQWHSGNITPVPTSTVLTAGTGLTGGGDLSTGRTFNVTYGTTAGTAAQGNDIRITNGNTAFGWGDFRTFGLGTTAQNIADLTTTDINQARFFRHLSGAVGTGGQAGSAISLPYDGTPVISILSVTPNGLLRIGTKIGATGTPTWKRVWDDSDFSSTSVDSWNSAFNRSVTGITHAINSAVGNRITLIRAEGSIQVDYKKLAVLDVRSAAVDGTNGLSDYLPTPNSAFWNNGLTPIFHTGWGGNSWGSSIVMKGWTAGYQAWMLSGAAATGSEQEELFLRTSNATTDTWTTPKRIWHSGNLRSDTDNDGRYVTLTGSQTIAGLKTFEDGSYEKLALKRTGFPSVAISYTGSDSETTYAGATSGWFGVSNSIVAFSGTTFRVQASTGNTNTNNLTVGGTLNVASSAVVVGEIQSKQAVGNLSFGMFSGNTSTRTWGIYNVGGGGDDLGLIRYGGLDASGLVLRIGRATNNWTINSGVFQVNATSTFQINNSITNAMSIVSTGFVGFGAAGNSSQKVLIDSGTTATGLYIFRSGGAANSVIRTGHTGGSVYFGSGNGSSALFAVGSSADLASTTHQLLTVSNLGVLSSSGAMYSTGILRVGLTLPTATVFSQTRISSAGTVISHNGSTAPNSNIYIRPNGDASATSQVVIDTGANIFTSGDVIAFSTSDQRLKDYMEPIKNAMEKIKMLKGYSFVWNAKQSLHKPGTRDVGVSAHEVDKVFPELVDTRLSGYKAVKYDKLVAVLIQGFNELQEKITKLESMI